MAQFQQCTSEGHSLVYGFDHASGYFLTVQDQKGQVVLHRSSALDGLTGGDLVEVAEQQGVTLPEDHQLCAMLDLPLGEWNPLLMGQ